MRVLVTGIAGYLASHTAVELLNAGHDVVGIDDLSVGGSQVIGDIERLGGAPIEFYRIDLRARATVDALIDSASVDAVIHFAGRTVGNESATSPLECYSRNVGASISLAEACVAHGVKRVVLSSSCAVFGESTILPIFEGCDVNPINPFGRTKALVEQMFADLCEADPSWSVTALRSFNPIGAHPRGLIGELPMGAPRGLVPSAMSVAVGDKAVLSIFGDDYATTDGTCVRDYVHVVDIARAHVAALDRSRRGAGFRALNLGTGVGRSVTDVVDAVRRVTGHAIPTVVGPRRDGDVAVLVAQPRAAEVALGWRADPDLDRMIRDQWRFERSVFAQRAEAS